MLLLFWSLFLLGTGLRFAGEAGVRRFDALSDESAQSAHAIVGRDPRWSVGVLAALAAVGTVLSASEGSTTDACVSGATVVVSLVCFPVLRSARRTVEDGMATRHIEPPPPVPPLPRSRTRTRRVRQFGAAMLGGYVVSTVALVVADRTGARWLDVAGLVLMVLAFAAFFALAWSAAWKFPDEEKPASRSQA